MVDCSLTGVYLQINGAGDVLVDPFTGGNTGHRAVVNACERVSIQQGTKYSNCTGDHSQSFK